MKSKLKLRLLREAFVEFKSPSACEITYEELNVILPRVKLMFDIFKFCNACAIIPANWVLVKLDVKFEIVWLA